MLAIKMKKVSFSYGNGHVLRNLNVSVRKGEFVGITGRLASGKSTLLLTLNGVIPHMLKGRYAGKIEVFGKDPSKHSVQELSSLVGMVFQNPDDQLFSLSVKEEVAFGLQNRNLGSGEIDAAVRNALSAVGLSRFAEKDPLQLSMGQKQKLAIATAIARSPPLLVLDEPTANLDYESSLEVYAILKKLNENGSSTVLVVDHNVHLLSKYCERLLILDNGRIAFDGKPLAVIKQARQRGFKFPAT